MLLMLFILQRWKKMKCDKIKNCKKCYDSTMWARSKVHKKISIKSIWFWMFLLSRCICIIFLSGIKNNDNDWKFLLIYKIKSVAVSSPNHVYRWNILKFTSPFFIKLFWTFFSWYNLKSILVIKIKQNLKLKSVFIFVCKVLGGLRCLKQLATIIKQEITCGR